MYQGPFLQSFVSPIFTCEQEGDAINAKRLHGTGFFVGEEGYFITATHVIQEAKDYIAVHGGQICTAPRQMSEGRPTDLYIPLLDISEADQPYDISIAATDYRVVNRYIFRDFRQQIGDDIHTIGYPISNTNEIDETFQIQARMQKGHIQRIIPPDRLRPGHQSTPNMFETSFAITHGMSGSPLVFSLGERQAVIGVCVASYSSRVVEYEILEYKDTSDEFREKVTKIEEFGLAHDLRPLFSWRPACLGGRTLREIVA